jgi:hypothetical protein
VRLAYLLRGLPHKLAQNRYGLQTLLGELQSL